MAGTDANTAPASPASPAVKTFSCPACNGQLEIRAPGMTVSVYCTHCGSELDAVNENVRLLQKYNEQLKLFPLLPLGQRGTLRGIQWEVIGFMQRSCGSYKWQEYLLFNPKNGFRWLVENQGHWTIYQKTNQTIDTKIFNRATFQNKDFKLFDDSTAKVDYVLGEFYWRVKRGEKARIQDFIAPPHILSQEQSQDGHEKGEKICSLGEYITREEIEASFKLARKLQWYSSVAPNQPNPYRNPGFATLLLGMMFCLLLLIVSFFLSQHSQPHQLLQQQYSGTRNDGSLTSQISPTFTVTQDHTVLGFGMNANVNNNWAELQIDLVNENTGNILQLEQGAEYWTGSDSDGQWSEGTGSSNKKLTRIPAGQYHVDVDYTWSRPFAIQPTPTTTTLTITEGSQSDINFWISCLILLLPPICVLMMSHFFETRRWADSPYNPYSEE